SKPCNGRSSFAPDRSSSSPTAMYSKRSPPGWPVARRTRSPRRLASANLRPAASNASRTRRGSMADGPSSSVGSGSNPVSSAIRASTWAPEIGPSRVRPNCASGSPSTSRSIFHRTFRRSCEVTGPAILAARGQEALDRTSGEIEALGAKALPVPTDATDAAQVQNLIDRSVETFGTIDILVNNAGSAPFLSTIDQIRLEGFEKYFRINFTSALYCTRAVAPVLLAKQ